MADGRLVATGHGLALSGVPGGGIFRGAPATLLCRQQSSPLSPVIVLPHLPADVALYAIVKGAKKEMKDAVYAKLDRMYPSFEALMGVKKNIVDEIDSMLAKVAPGVDGTKRRQQASSLFLGLLKSRHKDEYAEYRKKIMNDREDVFGDGGEA